MRAAPLALATAVAAGCATEVAPPEPSSPNAGMFRDFVDGKLDGAGHPLNARVTDGAALCGDATLAAPCRGGFDGGAQRGELVVNARLRVLDDGEGELVAVRVVDGPATVITRERLREVGAWIDVPVTYWSDGRPREVEIAPAPGVTVELAYVEVFPRRFGLVLSPGSGVIGDDDPITIELPRGETIDRVELDGADVTEAFAALATTRTDTEFRTLIEVRAGDLAPGRGDVAQLRVRAGGEAARLELRRSPAPCAYEGDPAGVPVLVTGFQPFPADGWHDNVSEVAVRALRPAALPGVRVLRLILPVEYDRAAAAVADAIARCAPAVVVSFGQGGAAIALEEHAYNLKDTGEVAGGVPDNRGVIAAAIPIDPAAPPSRPSTLPLDAIEASLRGLGEAPARSDDPGRYICNNVFFVAAGAAPRAGFIHLPYTARFDDAAVARWRAVAEAAVQSAAWSPPR